MVRSVPGNAPFDQPALLATLRARVARLEGIAQAPRAGVSIPVCDGLPLPGGGLARAAVHEVLAGAPGCGAGFAGVLLARTGGTVLWISNASDASHAWPPGLAGCGLDPAQLVLVEAPRTMDALWAMEESLRCSAVSGALLALGREDDAVTLDLSATRRLQLAAEAGGGLGLLLRPDVRERATPTAAATRWRIMPLPTACPASPRWRLELLRVRGGAPGGSWDVTWRSTERRLTLDAAAHLHHP